jgi:hypothetical protein
MSANSFSFTYADSDGAEGQIDLDAMRKLWVERDRSGIVFADVAIDGSETLHEVVMEGPEVAGSMADVMQTLLAARSFERIEVPAGQELLLEFRYPSPSTVALAYRA